MKEENMQQLQQLQVLQKMSRMENQLSKKLYRDGKVVFENVDVNIVLAFFGTQKLLRKSLRPTIKLNDDAGQYLDVNL
jgi:hypothetical protein